MSRTHLAKKRNSESDILVEAIVREWKNPKSQEPEIITEGGTEDNPRRVYVIWSKWQDIDQETRSEIIMDACERVLGPDKTLDVLFALGLTRTEAEEMKIRL